MMQGQLCVILEHTLTAESVIGLKTKHELKTIVREIGACAGLSVLLEVSGSPKPGNVHRYADFSDTKFEHFLASGIAIVGEMENAALKGIEIGLRQIRTEEAGMGEIIRSAVTQVRQWQRGGNTSLGTIILLTPLSVAAGIAYAKSTRRSSLLRIRESLSEILRRNTPEDVLQLYKAIRIASPGGLGKVSRLDVSDPSSQREILKEGVTLQDVFKISAERDSVSKEWTTSFDVSFNTGLPEFESTYQKTRNLNYATIHTFLRILSRVPDTLIARKRGIVEAERIAARAEEVLQKGGCLTEDGWGELNRFDSELRDTKNELNPGTSADLTAASIMLALLKGFRP